MGVISYIKKKVSDIFDVKSNIPEEYRSYYASRHIQDKKYLCHAPFNNMYFNSLGDVANCWLTFDQPEKYSEERSILDIWNGEKFSRLRENIRNFDLENRCQKCKYYIEHSNFTNALSKAYDNEYPLGEFPTMMEFELSNTCNLECTMCTGLLSSAIRANREHLPALKSPYGDKFVQELRLFIPHLHEARFNGGEPFLIKKYYDIWDQFIELNPQCKMVIATNGTTLNTRAKSILDKGNFHINISIDSLIPERYAQIRVNGDLKKVLEHFEYYKNYCQQNKRNICVMINPMRSNWDEMGEFVNFCNEHQVHLWFNTIMYPEDLSLWKMTHQELKEIYEYLSSIKFTYKLSYNRSIYLYNVETFENLVLNQIRTWMDDAQMRVVHDTQELDIDYRDAFFNQLKNFYALKNSHEEWQLVSDKVRELEVKFIEVESVRKMYKTLYQAPIEIVVEHLTNDDLDLLRQKLMTAN